MHYTLVASSCTTSSMVTDETSVPSKFSCNRLRNLPFRTRQTLRKYKILATFYGEKCLNHELILDILLIARK